jgi:hypothetical protein
MSTSATSSRARAGRKRSSDDAPYAAPSGAASALKRAANIDPDAAPRAKRKRLAPAPPAHQTYAPAGVVGTYAPSLRGGYDDEEVAEDVVRPTYCGWPTRRPVAMSHRQPAAFSPPG